MKKGSLSMTTIVVAVISILVLAIISYLIYDSFNSWDEASSCTAEGGRCVSLNECSQSETIGRNSQETYCTGQGQVCCEIG